MSLTLTTGIIPDKEYAADESNPMKIMVKEVIGGRTEPFTDEEVVDLINQRHLAFDPLIPLTSEEEELLKSNLAEQLVCRLNKGWTREFLQAECYLIHEASAPHGLHLYSVDSLKPRNKSLKPMAFEEKIVFLSNPRNLEIRWKRGNCTSTMAEMGYRSIEEYGQFGSNERFTKVIRKIQQDTEKSNFSILDLGGGVGLALHNAKTLQPELVTYNATRDEEYGYYDGVDFQIVCFLERMPLALEGKIDFIFSNMATRYLAFCDLTIRGCIEALASGGVMDVFFSSERSSNSDLEDIRRRTKTAYEYLKDLESSKLIKLSIDGKFRTNISDESLKAEAGTLYPASNVSVVKL